MVRLVARARTADPELLAGLVSPAAIAACSTRRLRLTRGRAQLEHEDSRPACRTRGSCSAITNARSRLADREFPYIVRASLARAGRGDEALPALRELEAKTPDAAARFHGRGAHAARGRRRDSVAAVTASSRRRFRDPEGRFYLARHLAHLGSVEPALALLQQVVDDGFFCYPVMERDPWLDSLRKKPAFTKLLRSAEAQHRRASERSSGWMVHWCYR